MKKLVLLVMTLVAVVSAAYAQPRAIGGRVGYGVEVSYQHTVNEKNMVSVDLGLPAFFGLEAAATYDWVNPGDVEIPWEHKGSWNWYAGVGAAAGFYGFDYIVGFGGVAGRIGVEYNFWFPLQLSIDYRPIIGVAGRDGGAMFNKDALYAGAIALGVRYVFE